MIPARHRIPREFLTKPKGRKLPFPFGTVVILPVQEAGAAVIASKKNFKTAVVRNRVRRRIYAALRISRTRGMAPHSVIVYPNHAALGAPFTELTNTLLEIVGRTR